MKIFLLILLLSTNLLHAKSALIFNGAGTCEGCGEAIGKLLLEKNFEVKYVTEKNLDQKSFEHLDLYVQPGGSDDVSETTKALTPKQVKVIQNYVSLGGNYLGVCAGAYLAGKYIDEKLKQPGFDLIEIREVDQELANTNAAKLITVKLNNMTTRQVYYQAGPHFGYKLPANAKAYAYYLKSGHIAARFSKYKNGTVGLIGPHYEADKDWYEEDHLSAKYGFNIDLFNQFIEELLRK